MNVRSLRGDKVDQLEVTLSSMSCEIHILVLSKFGLTYIDETFLFNLKEYCAYFKCRNKRSGGCAVYVDSRIGSCEHGSYEIEQ